MFEDQLANVPKQPPRAGVLPGMRFGAAIPRATLILVLAFILLFATLPLSILNSDPKAKLSLGPSTTTEGRVLAATEVSGCRGSASRRIVYVFSAQSGNEFRGSVVVCEESSYYSAQGGDKIAIRYLTRDPAVSAVAGMDDNEPPVFFFMIFPFFFLVVFAPLHLPQLREVMRARRLYKNGTLAQGKVIFVRRRSSGTWPGWPGSSTSDVYVSYQSPSGGAAETVAWCANDWLINQLSPGSTVHVLLPPDKSSRSALLEAYIR